MKKREKSLIVLCYHKINSRKYFEQQLIFLNNSYTIISSTELMEYFENKIELPKKPLLITFDDGDPSLYENAFPILKKYDIPAVIFVITSLIDSFRAYWWDEMEYYLGAERGHKKSWEVKDWPNKKREEYLSNLKETTGKKNLKYKQLSNAQLKEMQEGGIVIANHSHTHPIFDRCTLEELNMEMDESSRILGESGFTPDVFAYPNGNYSQDSETVLKKFGVKYAFLFDHKINQENINPLRISRLIVNDSTPLWKFKLILSGWHSRILPFTKAIGRFYRKFY